MATPWFRVESSMITHPKVYDLAELLKLKSSGGVKANVVAAGLVVGVWSWATQNAADGDLTNVPMAAIAEAAGWTKKPQTFFDALIKAGFVDKDGDELWLHDWIDYASKLAEQEEKKKASTAERVRKHRENKRRSSNAPVTQCNAPSNSYPDQPCNAECNSYSNSYSNAPVTQCNAPYITEHNITLHNNSSNTDRKDIIDTTPIPVCNVTDGVTPSVPEWVSDPDYIPSLAEIESITDFTLKMDMIRRRMIQAK